MDFNFLNNIVVQEEEVKKAVRTSAPKLPEGNSLRVFASGRVYPSLALVAALNLEYTAKDAVEKGNGLDVFKSTDWPVFPANPNMPKGYILVAAVARTESKIDLFSSCGYDDAGVPKTSVTEQGGGSFGPKMVKLLEEVYEVVLEKGGYIDVEVNLEVAIPSSNNVYFIPKVVSRGERAGEVAVSRRENIAIHPLVPVVESVETPTQVETVTAAEDTPEEAPEEQQVEAPQDNPFATEAPETPEAMPPMPAGGANFSV